MTLQDAKKFARRVQFISPLKCFDLPREKIKVSLRFVDGVIAQLVERLNGIQKVRSSSLLGSTILNGKKSPWFSRTKGFFVAGWQLNDAPRRTD